MKATLLSLGALAVLIAAQPPSAPQPEFHASAADIEEAVRRAQAQVEKPRRGTPRH